MPRFFKTRFEARALKHKKESMTNRTSEKRRPSGRYVRGFKSHRVGLLPCEENGKCDTAKYCAEFLSIGSHSPEHK
ncbi:MAG: hypothetical protein KJ714_02660 [Euryarchaeota archaeon]|nr:hypothetical protein [Euryarchaeota archaeon]